MKSPGIALAADRLDDPVLVEAADPGEVLRRLASASAEVRTALRASRESDLDGRFHRPRAIVVAGPSVYGMLLSAIAGAGAPTPVVAAAGQLPGWVGAADLVLAVSGAEASVAVEAVRRGCQFATIGLPGDDLRRIAEQARAPHVPVQRAGLWSLTIPLLVIAEQLGVARVGGEAYEAAASAMEDIAHQCRPTSESFVNPGKSLALDLLGTLPVIWGGSDLAFVAARRFVGQLMTTARHPAIAGQLAEAVRDQIAMLDGPFAPAPRPVFPEAEDVGGLDADSGPDPLHLVLLADQAAEPRRLTELRETAAALAGERGVAVTQLAAEGDHPLRRLAGLVQLTDYAAVYLAIACGNDPGAAPAIQDFAERVVLHLGGI